MSGKTTRFEATFTFPIAAQAGYGASITPMERPW
jgi:hypothetical protein